MITFKKARAIAQTRITKDLYISEDFEEITNIGWCFHPVPRGYLEKGPGQRNTPYLGGILVNRKSGETFLFGAAFNREYWYEVYRRGLHKEQDFIIFKINKKDESLNFLKQLNLRYPPEKKPFAGISIRNQFYKKEEIEQIISNLPCRFEKQYFPYKLKILKAIEKEKAMEYRTAIPQPIQKNVSGPGDIKEAYPQ